tara:strand:- start:7180 stop:7647 length:468 start_codon:yes stop_codon:yes gene_type:complete
MTTHIQIKRRGQATADSFCELQQILDAAAPFADALDEAKQSLVEVLNDPSVLQGDVSLDDYKGNDSAFKFPEQGLNIVIQPRYALVLNPSEPEPRALVLAKERIAKYETALKKAKLDLKNEEEKLVVTGKATRCVKSFGLALRKIATLITPLEID